MDASKSRRKNEIRGFVLCLVFCCTCLFSSANLRDSVEVVFMRLDGVLEATGNNDGPEVKAVLASCGLPEGYPYCAATVNWVFIQAGINTGVKSPAWSPSWFANPNKVVYRKSWKNKDFKAKKSQVFGLYYQNLKRVGHVGFIRYESGNNYHTFEGNTNAMGSREGDGFHRKIRSKQSIHVISDYIDDEKTKDWRKNNVYAK